MCFGIQSSDVDQYNGNIREKFEINYCISRGVNIRREGSTLWATLD